MTPQQELELFETLGEIKSGIRSMTRWTESHEILDRETFEAHSKRITSLEKKVWTATGVIAFLMFVIQSIRK